MGPAEKISGEFVVRYCAALYQCDKSSGMRTVSRAWTAIATATVFAMLLASFPARVEATPDEPQTLTLRIRLRGPTMRVRCRAGDCNISIVGEGNLFHVSIVRTGANPITFSRDLQNPTNINIEAGDGTDTITVTNVTIPGFLRITGGGGDDTLDISNLNTGGKTSINTGRGNDTVHAALGTIGDKFRLGGDSGDDDVSLNGAYFTAKSGFDGGTGFDTFHMLSNPVGFSPLLIHFEP